MTTNYPIPATMFPQTALLTKRPSIDESSSPCGVDETLTSSLPRWKAKFPDLDVYVSASDTKTTAFVSDHDDQDESVNLLNGFVTELFSDWSLFHGDGKINIKISPSDDQSSAGHEVVFTYGVQNSASYQYSQGFPFCPINERRDMQAIDEFYPWPSRSLTTNKRLHDHHEAQESSLLVLTLCPPHDIEWTPPDIAKFMSFDLGFSVMEKNNQACIESVVKNSLLMRFGVRPLYKIMLAFEDTLSSLFHSYAYEFSVSSCLGPISFLTESHPDVALYYSGEQESRAAAAYAMSCVRNGYETTYESFLDMFPFDIRETADSYKPAEFSPDQDPILYLVPYYNCVP